MLIRVRAGTKHEDVLEALRNLGVEAVAGEETIGESLLFLVNRLNAKLDNLGQLRHFHKTLLQLTDIKQALKPITFYFQNINDERYARQKLNQQYYDQLVEQTGHRPDTPVPLYFMTTSEIRALFPVAPD